jgi:hypothetical protein
MVKAADALWGARVATNLRSQPPRHSKAGAPLPAAVREVTKGVVTPTPKVAPLPAQIFTHFKTLAMACENFTITMAIGLAGAFRPVLGRKTKLPPNRKRFGGFSHTSHCHSYAFSCKCWLDFLTNELTNERYLVDTGATLSIVPCNQNSSPSGPLLKGADGQPIPSWGFIKKTVQFQASFLHQPFCKLLWQAPFWALTS